MKTTKFKKTILATAVVVMLSPVHSGAKPKPNKVKHFGKNAPFLIDELPTGKVKSKLKALRSDKKKKAMKRLHSFEFTTNDLRYMEVDDEGDILYGDSFEMTELTDTTTGTTEQPQAVSATDTFKLHSKPGASNVIYIDVDGHTISGTAWNGSTSTIQARPFDTDGNTATFSSTELAQIAEIWHRVAEDFAPFNTDVTTEEPTNFGPTTGRLLITHNKDVSGNNMPYSNAGGVAYINVWGRSNYASYYSPALVYYNNLASFPPYISEAASHEMGHNLGLSHDGNSTQTYYAGHGSGFVSWAPIMGVGYYNNITQWSKGEYTGASMTQDDISIIGNHLNFRTDDHGSDINTPTPLLVDEQGNISVSSPEADPHNFSPDNKGIIENRNDVDFFAFDAGAGALDITVTPAWDSFYRSSRRGANLDVQASLYSWDGQLIASSDPLNETDAQITTNVSSGQYLLAISGVGNNVTPYSDYGSLGQYYISGTIEPFSPVTDNTPPSPNPMSWTVAPYSQSRSSISMQASTATDDSGSVEYNFICVSGTACNDSGWQASNQYTATGLLTENSYSFQVIARDTYNNETNPSSTASATTAANNAPQTQNSSVSTPEDSELSIDLAAQSSDADADPLTFAIQTQPSHGTVVNNNGTVNYTPASNYNGTDSLSYTVNDGFGGTASGTVTITVTAVNDAPQTQNSSVSTPENTGLSIDLAAQSSDADADPLTFAIQVQPAHGTVVNNNGTVNYTPASNFNGEDSFSYSVNDGFGGTASGAVTITVTAVNNPPQTQDSSVSTPEDTSLSIDLAAQSSDADADPLTFFIQSQPAHGTVINQNNGTVNYTPANNFNGADSFSYTVNDGFGGTASGTVTITVTPVNDAPVASASAPSTNSTLTVSFSSAGSFDPDSTDTLSYNWNFGDGNSSNAANPSHSYSVEGSYNITLSVTDNNGLTDTASITTSVSDPTNVIPDAPSNLTYTILDKQVTGNRRRKQTTVRLELNWDASNSATKYDIWRCKEATSRRRKNRTCIYAFYASTDSTSYIDTITDEPARYKIAAGNSNGTSDTFSNEVRVKP